MVGTQPHPWFSLQVRTRCESIVALHLEARGYECFLPKYEARRKWSDRYARVELPLFPGYLFCRLNVSERLPVLTAPGVIQIVGVGRTPIPVEQHEIAAIQTMVKSGLPAHPWPFLQVGDRVRIEHGRLNGLEGILLHHKGKHRLVVSVTLLQRAVALEIDAAWVSKDASARSARIPANSATSGRDWAALLNLANSGTGNTR